MVSSVAERPIEIAAGVPPEAGACPLCDSRATAVVARRVRDCEYAAPGEYCWLRCDGCGLIRLDPMPTDEVLALAYPSDYHAYVGPRSGLTSKLIALARARNARALTRRLAPGACVLDIGCATGLLLEAIGRRSGCRLYGVEYKPEAAAEARRRGIEVWEGELEQADIRDASMDLALMQHVLEHVRNPVETLRSVHRVLAPGGRLAGELPNFDSWDARLFGRFWGGGHAPRHLWHFTPDSLRAALRHAGFVDVEIAPALHTGHWALSIQHALRRGRTDGLVSGRAWYYPLLLVATIPVNCLQMAVMKTGVMRFTASKPS